MENKNKNNNVLKFVLGLFIIMFSVSSISAITQHELINYQFEENGGSVIIDSSGNNNHGSNSGCSWNTNNVFGTYALDFDGDKDYITISSSGEIPEKTSFSLWVRPYNNDDEILINMYDSTDLLQVWIDKDGGADNLYLKYKDTSGTIQNLNLDSVNFNNVYVHLVLSFNFSDNSVTYYRDNSLITTLNLNSFSRVSESVLMRVGANIDGTQNEFDGVIDSFRVFDFNVNVSQVDSLYNLNDITLKIDNEENETEYNGTTEIKIINTLSPSNNEIMFNHENIEVNLLKKADCELYIDNKLKESYKGVLGFTYPLTEFPINEYHYFVYCEALNGEVLEYELTNITSFTIEKPSKTIEFFMYNSGGDLLSDFDDLYLVTPCLTHEEESHYNIPDRELYIQKLIGGHTYFNLSYDSDYDFCLLKGKINYKEDKFSMFYDIEDLEKKTNLGTLFVNNETYTYSLKTDNTDLYKVSSPEFWGKTWSALFQLIIGVLIGGFIIFLGLITGFEKLMIVGGFIIAIGMGLGMTTFVGAII